MVLMVFEYLLPGCGVPTVGVTRRVRVGQMKEHVMKRLRAEIGDERVHQRARVRLINIQVNFVAPVVRADEIGRAVGRIPTRIEQREFRFAHIRSGAQTVVMRHVKNPGNVESTIGSERDARRRVRVAGPAVSVGSEHRSSGQLAGVIRKGDRVIVIGARIVGERALRAKAVEVREIGRPQGRDGVRAQSVHADMDHMFDRASEGR
jgi:hypothetical protein